MNKTKPKIMRRVAYSQSEAGRTCLGCGFVLQKKGMPDWVDRLTCPRCKTIMQVKHTDHGTVVLTNEEFADLFIHNKTAQIWIREEEDDDKCGVTE